MKKLMLLTIGLLCCLSALCQQRLEQGKQYYKWGDYARALPLLQQAAKEGYGEACYLLGNMYYYGNGTEKNYTIAMRMYERGLEFGYHLGNAELGVMYENGDGCAKDPGKAFAYYSKSRQAGERLAIYQLARCYFHGIGTEQNYEQAYTLFSSLSRDYDFKKEYEWACQWTCMFLGFCYEYGYGTEIDLDKAVESYKNSEKPDYLYRAYLLVGLHSLKYDRLALLESAVLKGYDDGQVLYEYVQLKLEKKDGAIDTEIFNYLVRATETYPPAWKLLGDCYRLGHGTVVNLMKARECYGKVGTSVEEVEAEEKTAEDDRIKAGIFKVGDLHPALNGVVFYVDNTGKHGNVVSLDEVLMSGHQGEQWAKAKGPAWRMITTKDFVALRQVKDVVNKSLVKNGGAQFQDKNYWAETFGAYRYECSVNGFRGRTTSGGDKLIRAVGKF